MTSRFRTALRSIPIAFIATVVWCSVPSAAHAGALGCADNSAGTQDRSSFNADILAKTNAHRAGLGLPALALDPVLSKAALWKANDMGLRNYFSHEDPKPGGGSRTPWERLADCGYDQPSSTRAENIAAGQQSGAAFAAAWIASPGHRANIENPAMRYIGIGTSYVGGSAYGSYSVQMFSSKSSGVAPLAPPAAPSIAQVTLVAGSHVDVCPPASAAGVRFEIGASTGPVFEFASIVGSCVRVAAGEMVDPGTVYVPYRAVNSAGASAYTNLAVTIEQSRTLAGLDPSAGSATSLRGSTARIARVKCGRTLCWRLTIAAKLRTSSGAPVVGQRVAFARIDSRGKRAGLGAAATDSKGVATVTRVLHPPKRGTAAWLRRTWTSANLQFTGSSQFAASRATARVRV